MFVIEAGELIRKEIMGGFVVRGFLRTPTFLISKIFLSPPPTLLSSSTPSSFIYSDKTSFSPYTPYQLLIFVSYILPSFNKLSVFSSSSSIISNIFFILFSSFNKNFVFLSSSTSSSTSSLRQSPPVFIPFV